MRTALVVGAEPDPAELAEAVAKADRTLFYSFAVAHDLADETGRLGELVDISAELWDLDATAWAWAGDFTECLRSQDRWIAPDVLDVAQRRLHVDVFWRIALARARAEAVRARLDDGSEIRSVGVTDLERDALLALSTHGAGTDSAMPAVPHDSPTADGEPEPWLRSAARAMTEAREMAKRTADLAAEHAPGAETPTVVALAAVPIHIKLLESPLRALQARGWRCIVLEVFTRGDLSAQAAAVGASWLNIAPFLPECEYPWRSPVGGRRRAKLERIVRAWTRSSGLEAHEATILSGLEAELVHSQRFVRGYETILRSIRPQAVLSVSELYPGIEPVSAAGRRLGIPVVHVQHGNIPEIARMSDFPYDAFCVFGEAYAETLERLGTPRGRIRVTGSPHMDLMPSAAEEFADCVTRLRSGETIPESAFESVERRYAFGADGRAGERIADACEELAATPRRPARS